MRQHSKAKDINIQKLSKNAHDLVDSGEIGNIFENFEFIHMLNQGLNDRKLLARQLGISEFLFFGDVIIPFQTDTKKEK